MRNIFKYIILSGLAVLLFVYYFIPIKKDIYQILELFFILPIFFYVFIPRLSKQNINISGRINLGLVFFGAMLLILIVGNISVFVIKFVFPIYDDNLRATNLYYLAGVFFFTIGFLWKVKKIKKNPTFKNIFSVKITFIFLLTLFSFISLIIATTSIGFIPFLHGGGGGVRYVNFATSSFFIRMWSLCVISAVLSFIYILHYKKYFLVYLFFVLSVLFSLYFFIRMYPFLIAISVVFIWYSSLKNSRKKNIFMAIGVVAFFSINMLFVDYREEGENINAIRKEKKLNFVQKNLFYTTFNEYGQLQRAINTYHAKPLYGKTLLSIPVGFIPAPFLSMFGINKSDIQKNNSARIMAKHFHSKVSTGIRIGLMGELYINFKFYGCLFMIFVGMFVGYIQNKINSLDSKDFRYGMYIIIFTILIYSLIGQIDVIGSLLGNYIILFLLLKLFMRRFV